MDSATKPIGYRSLSGNRDCDHYHRRSPGHRSTRALGIQRRDAEAAAPWNRAAATASMAGTSAIRPVVRSPTDRGASVAQLTSHGAYIYLFTCMKTWSRKDICCCLGGHDTVP